MDFTRKARWVKDGHKTPNSTTSSFAGVVSRDSIRIALTHAALLGLPVIVGGPADEFPANFFYFFVSRPKTVKTDSAKNLKKSDRPRTD